MSLETPEGGSRIGRARNKIENLGKPKASAQCKTLFSDHDDNGKKKRKWTNTTVDDDDDKIVFGGRALCIEHCN